MIVWQASTGKSSFVVVKPMMKIAEEQMFAGRSLVSNNKPDRIDVHKIKVFLRLLRMRGEAPSRPAFRPLCRPLGWKTIRRRSRQRGIHHIVISLDGKSRA